MLCGANTSVLLAVLDIALLLVGLAPYPSSRGGRTGLTFHDKL